MEKMKVFVKKNKIFVAITAVLIVAVGGFFIVNTFVRSEANIEFGNVVYFEYGETAKVDDITKLADIEKSNFDTIVMENVIDTKSNVVAIQKVANDKGEFDPAKLSELKPNKAKITISKGDKKQEVTLEYYVVDTKVPVIEGAKDVYYEEGEELAYLKNVKAHDVVGDKKEDVKLTFAPDADKTKVGTTEVTATAVDKAGNKTEVNFKVTVTKKSETPKPETEKPTSDSGSNPSGGNDDYYDDTDYSDDGGGETPTPQPEPTPEPEIPTKPSPEAPSPMHSFYGDYGTTAGCATYGESVMWDNVEVWSSYYCDDFGYMWVVYY